MIIMLLHLKIKQVLSVIQKKKNNNGTKEGVRIAVPLKHLSNFCR